MSELNCTPETEEDRWLSSIARAWVHRYLPGSSMTEDELVRWLLHYHNMEQEMVAGSLFQSPDPDSVEQDDSTRQFRIFRHRNKRWYWVYFPIHFLYEPTDTFPPELSSTRIESDFYSSITTVQRMSPLRLFKIRLHWGPIILPCS